MFIFSNNALLVLVQFYIRIISRFENPKGAIGCIWLKNNNTRVNNVGKQDFFIMDDEELLNGTFKILAKLVCHIYEHKSEIVL